MSDQLSDQEKTGVLRTNHSAQSQQPDLSGPLSEQTQPEGIPTNRLPENLPLRKSNARGWRLPRTIFLLLLGLVLGIVLGVLGGAIFLLTIGGSNTPIVTGVTNPSSENVTMHVQSSVLIPLIEQSWQSSGTPGSISNLHLQFTVGDQATLTGIYQVSVFGITLSQPFTVVTQPFAQQCHVHLRILSADFSGVSVTSLVTSFENTINQQLQSISRTLPGNMTYCINTIQTDATGVIAFLSVTSAYRTPSPFKVG